MTSHRIGLSSSIEHCGVLRQCIQAFGRMEGYDERFVSLLELSVHEAFVNAVRHGNASNPELPVTVTLNTGSDMISPSLQVEIADCGTGFTLDGRTELDAPGLDSAPGGRGLPLIAHFAREIRAVRKSGGSVLILSYIPY
ncbi:MAG: ATP-binding protein [Chlorobiaceae bacterium]|nr:ATP-binding protein [Chlorobiaceae bacterium]NTV26894.1 ATP-binding protein [Chlorobiaceae bacterium]